MINSIFIAGAYTSAVSKLLNIYEELADCISNKYPKIQIVCPRELDIFRLNFIKNHPNASIQQVDAAMVKYDLDFIKNCDLFIANVTERSTGLGIELGSLLNADKRILFVAESGATVSNMIIGAFSQNEIHFYDDFEELKCIVLDYLNEIQA